MEECEKCESKNINLITDYDYHNIYECQDCQFWLYEKLNDCCRDPFKIVVIDRKNYSLYFIREQCFNCGGCINKRKPLSSKKYSQLIKGALNIERDEEYKSILSSEKNLLFELKKEHSRYNSRQAKYHRYLQTKEWKTIRNKVLKRDNSICKICNENKADDVHHKTYENVFNEKLEDLVSVCRKCHSEIHFPSLSNL
tara:strand:- start:404 stop:994 length:591 start_codon:yes stop_codon:yes gene_type:complete